MFALSLAHRSFHIFTKTEALKFLFMGTKCVCGCVYKCVCASACVVVCASACVVVCASVCVVVCASACVVVCASTCVVECTFLYESVHICRPVFIFMFVSVRTYRCVFL